jgi:hypothetical protein
MHRLDVNMPEESEGIRNAACCAGDVRQRGLLYLWVAR